MAEVEIPAGTIACCDRCGRAEKLTESIVVPAEIGANWTEVVSACPCGDGLLTARRRLAE